MSERESNIQPSHDVPGTFGNPTSKSDKHLVAFKNLLAAAGHVYLVGLLIWAALRWLWHDGLAVLYLANVGALYLFAPLPLLLLVAWITRRRELWVGFGLAAALGAALFGPLWMPKRGFEAATARAGDLTLTVMSYNMLGSNVDTDAVVRTIRAADADVVGVQEINPEAAEAIRRELSGEYPYQVLDPQVGVTGMGVLSRYPLTLTGETLPELWIGTPQVLRLDFAGTPVWLLHLHFVPPTFGSMRYMPVTIEVREAEARAVREFLAQHPGPALVVGDLNATDQNRAHALLTRDLRDAWREAGWGCGHTYPGGLGIRWLARIDYVFYNDAWRALDASVGPWDGASDHRPVVASLVLE